MDRTFHHRFTIGAACGIALLFALSLYAFWMRQPVIGALLALGLIAVMEQSLHKQYIFHADQLIIDNGRLWRSRTISLNQINSCRSMRTTFGMVHYLLISYGPAEKVAAVQPRNEQAFVECLRKRMRQTGETAAEQTD